MTTLARDALTLAIGSAAVNVTELHRHVDGARSGEDPEHVHHMRVALRRLRGAALVADRAGAGFLSNRLVSELKWLAQALGSSRDWDVFANGTWHAIRSEVSEPTTVAQIEAAIARHRAASQRRLRRTLRTRRFANVMRDIDAATTKALDAAPSSVARSRARKTAHRVLSKRARRVLAGVKDVRALTPEVRHSLRIDVKKLRYTAELLSALYRQRPSLAYLRRLIGVQSALGELNDLAVGESTIEVIARDIHPGERAVLRRLWQGYLEKREPRLQKRLATTWTRFCASEPFW